MGITRHQYFFSEINPVPSESQLQTFHFINYGTIQQLNIISIVRHNMHIALEVS